jgi:hypothetical protein
MRTYGEFEDEMDQQEPWGNASVSHPVFDLYGMPRQVNEAVLHLAHIKDFSRNIYNGETKETYHPYAKWDICIIIYLRFNLFPEVFGFYHFEKKTN